MPETTTARVRKIICEILTVDSDKISDDTLLSDGGADSIDRIDVSMAIEDEFDFRMTDQVAEANVSDDATINTISAFVGKMVA